MKKYLFIISIIMFLLTIHGALAAERLYYMDVGHSLSINNVNAPNHQRCNLVEAPTTQPIVAVTYYGGTITGTPTMGVELWSRNIGTGLPVALLDSYTGGGATSGWYNVTDPTPSVSFPSVGTKYWLCEVCASDCGNAPMMGASSTVWNHTWSNDGGSTWNLQQSIGAMQIWFQEEPFTIQLLTPLDNNFNNTDPMVFTFNDTAINETNCSLQFFNVNWTDNATVAHFNHSNVSSIHMINTTLATDTTYIWRINCTDGVNSVVSENRTLYYDIVKPDFNIKTIKTDNTTELTYSVNKTLVFNDNVTDTNLYGFNVSVRNSTNDILYTIQQTNLNVTVAYMNDTVNISTWAVGNYTINYYAVDDHTYGTLNNLTYEINIDGITFTNGVWTKKIWFGYYLNNEFHFLTPQQVAQYNISASITDPTNGEFKYSMLFNRPAVDLPFGFAIPKEKNLILREESIGHFVWGKWYLDFEDLPQHGFPITVKETTDYWLVYTNSGFCPVNTGEQCDLDPVIGGLNVANETYSFTIIPLVPAGMGNIDCVYNANPTPDTQEFLCTITNATGNNYTCYGVTYSDTNELLDVTPRQTKIEGVGFLSGFVPQPKAGETQHIRMSFSNKRVKQGLETTYKIYCDSPYDDVSYFYTTTPEYIVGTHGVETAVDLTTHWNFYIASFFFILFILIILMIGWRATR